jgi:hypothetical protein
MKKAAVLFILFVFPIVAYLFFATGVNSFMYLPTLTKSVPELGAWQSLHQKPVALTKKITILGFPGRTFLKTKAIILTSIKRSTTRTKISGIFNL